MRMNRLLSGLLSLALVTGGASVAAAAEGKEKASEAKATKVSFQDVPAAVRKTLQREAFGAKMDMVDKEQLDGKTVYEVDVDIDGENYEIVVDAKGKLIHKKLDNEAEEATAKESAEGKEGKSARPEKESGEQKEKAAKGKAAAGKSEKGSEAKEDKEQKENDK
jgi:PBP1b-binding outer membrane lipoprotein LpoB